MKQFWDERFSTNEYIYGTEPNDWFRSVIDRLPAGKVLIPGAGEGRDAVYAARLGWQVHAFDQSTEGRKKAYKLAKQHNVNILFEVIDAEKFNPGKNRYDLIAMVFFHLPEEIRLRFHQQIISWLKPGGYIMVEAFHKAQVNNNSGGPNDLSLLLTSSQLAKDFDTLEITENSEITRTLNEGSHHHGKAALVRFLAQLKH